MIINRRYEILRKLGEGRSQIFLVKDFYFPDEVFAMKVISSNAMPSEIQSFKNEYYLLKGIDHPNIIKPYFNGTVRNIIGENHFAIVEEDYFFTMEFIDGKSLSELDHEFLQQNHEEIIVQIALVLFYLHQSNLIYYDLKLENILLESNKNINIKFIDFGFAEENYRKPIENIKGSPFFISPEILTHSIVDHRTDIYSFGILIYWILFGAYPFNAKDELDIYKLHISSKIKFPLQTNIEKKICDVIERCTIKNPADRFANTLLIAAQFCELSKRIFGDSFSNINKYYKRTDIEIKVNNFLDDKNVFMCLICGEENSGKSKIIGNVKKNVSNSFIIDFGNQFDVLELWKRIIVELLLIDSINYETRNSLLNYFENHFNESEEKVDEVIITIFSKISSESEFILMIDNYDLCDEFSKAVLLKLLNVLVINQKKSIITSKDLNVLSNLDKIKIVLTPLSETEVDDFVDKTFSEDFPKFELAYLINKYSDKNIGSINNFIKELISLGIISYSHSKASIKISDENEKIIAERITNILEIKYQNLNIEESRVICLISTFESISENQISELLNFDLTKTESILNHFENLNILYSRRKILSIKFIAESYRQYFYNKIADIQKFHYAISQKISNRKDINVKNKLFHFEKANEYLSAIDSIQEELKKLKTVSAYTSMSHYYSRIISYPIEDKIKINFKIDLLDTLIKMNDIKSAENLLKDIDIYKGSKINLEKLSYLRGLLIYRLGRVKESLEIFNKMLKNNSKDDSYIKIEIANICIDLADYQRLFAICSELINGEDVPQAIIGRAYNFLAIGKIYESNNFSEAAELFTKSIRIYEKINDKDKIAGIELNLGNVLNTLGNSKLALEHWERARVLNQNIGNFTQEANALQNLGVYYFQNFDCENSIEKYRRAKQIFETIGDKSGVAITYYNIAESKIFSMEFQDAEKFIKKAISIYEMISNEDGKYSSYMLSVVVLKKAGLIDDIRNIKLLFEKINDISSMTRNWDYVNFIENLLVNELTLTEKFLEEVLSNLLNSNNIFLIFDLIVELSSHSHFGLIKNSVIPFLEREKNLIQKEYFRALLFFLQGQIVEAYPESFPEMPINYYLKSYEILNSLSVSELTLMVIFKIAKFYSNSGNFWKSKEFFNYLKTLFDYVIEHILDEKFLVGVKNSILFSEIISFINSNKKKFI